LNGLRLQEREQVFIELLLVRDCEAVGRAWIYLQGRAPDEFGREQGRVGNGHDLVIITTDDQGRNVAALEVVGLLGLGEGLDAVVGRLETNLH